MFIAHPRIGEAEIEVCIKELDYLNCHDIIFVIITFVIASAYNYIIATGIRIHLAPFCRPEQLYTATLKCDLNQKLYTISRPFSITIELVFERVVDVLLDILNLIHRDFAVLAIEEEQPFFLA